MKLRERKKKQKLVKLMRRRRQLLPRKAKMLRLTLMFLNLKYHRSLHLNLTWATSTSVRNRLKRLSTFLCYRHQKRRRKKRRLRYLWMPKNPNHRSSARTN